MVRSLLLAGGARPLRPQPMASGAATRERRWAGRCRAGLGGMAEERGMAVVTCTAPVNIAVIKYCECGAGGPCRAGPSRVVPCQAVPCYIRLYSTLCQAVPCIAVLYQAV